MGSVKNGCIYALIDPDTREVRYIGQTHDPSARLKQHLKGDPKRPTPKDKWIKSLTRYGEEPIMEELEWCTEEELDQRERAWIAQKRIEGCNLLNGDEDEPIPGKRKAQSTDRYLRYFTVEEFAVREGLKINTVQASSLGKEATRYSCANGYPIHEIPHGRFGHVNTYHEDVLRAVFRRQPEEYSPD